MYLALILVACARATYGEIMDGVCDPNVKSVEHIDVKKLPFYWYGYESVGDESTTSCPTVKVYFEGKKIVIDTMFVQDGKLRVQHNSSVIVDRKPLHKEEIFSDKDTPVAPFTFVHMDEMSSVVLYLCKQITPATKKIVAWKFSKDPAIPEHVRAENDAAVQQYPELAAASWRKRGRDNCPALN